MMRLPLVLSLAAFCAWAPLIDGHASEHHEASAINNDLHLDNASVRELARSRAYAVSAAQAALDGAKAERGAALSPYRPQVQAGLNWRRMGETPSAAMGGSANRHSYQGQITLEQSLLTFGRKYHSAAVSKSIIESASIGLLSAERDAALRALAALESYRFAVATKGVAEARVEQRQGELNDAEKLFEVGNVRMLDVRQTRINLTLALDALRQSEADVAGARADLISSLALSPEQSFTIDDELTRPTELGAAINTAQQAIAENLDLRGLEQARRIQQQRARLELSDGLPTVGGVLGYTQSGRRLNDMDDDWYVGIGVNWRLLDGGGRYARRNALLAEARRVDVQIDALSSERQREIAVIQADASALDARIALQQSVVADSEQNYEDARILYQTGEITLTRVGEAGLAVSEAQFNLNRYRFEESVLAHRLQAFSE